MSEQHNGKFLSPLAEQSQKAAACLPQELQKCSLAAKSCAKRKEHQMVAANPTTPGDASIGHDRTHARCVAAC